MTTKQKLYGKSPKKPRFPKGVSVKNATIKQLQDFAAKAEHYKKEMAEYMKRVREREALVNRISKIAEDLRKA